MQATFFFKMTLEQKIMACANNIKRSRIHKVVGCNKQSVGYFLRKNEHKENLKNFSEKLIK